MKVFKKKLVSTMEQQNSNGITLIALVITIIVLLILAGVSLSAVFSQDGIFSRAEQATNKYGQAKARETLEITLGESQLQKYEEGLTEAQLDRKIQEIGELLPKEDPNPNIQDVIVEGYIFKVDKSVPKIIDYVGPADGIIITAVLSNNATDGWLSATESDVNIKGKIMTYSGGKITTVSAKSGETPISGFSIDKDGLYEINHITDSSIITIEAEDSKGKKNKKEINVEVKVDKTAPTVETINVVLEGRKIKLSATGHDKDINGEEQSGIKEFNYTITPTDGVDKASGTFSKNGTAEINVTNWSLYTIKVTATDRCLNTTETPKEQTADIRDTTAPTIEAVNAEVEGLTIKLSATGHDRDATGQEGSGIANFSYTITPADGLSKTSGTFSMGETAIITSSLEKTYTITVNAADNAGNPTKIGKQATATTINEISVEYAKNKINESNIQEYIGTKVNYNPKAGGVWRVFYYDSTGYFGKSNTVYLKRDYTSQNNKNLRGYQNYISSDNYEIMKKMNPLWASKLSNDSLNRKDEHCVAWLCDSKNFIEYKTANSSFAIGAPSVEMYTRAYNQWKGSSNALVCKFDTTSFEYPGYNMGVKGSYENTNSKYIESGPEGTYLFGPTDGSMWLSSPATSNNYTEYIYSTLSDLKVPQGRIYSENSGCCPIVPLDL